MKLMCLDTETTGIDVFNDRIVTLFAGILDTETGEWDDSINLLVNPGVDIPEGAAKIHGVTTRVAKSFGMSTWEALEELDIFLREQGDMPLVVMNANYDLTLIREEFRRNNWLGNGAPIENPDYGLVIDPLVIDRHHDRFRKGSRKLVDLARHYGVAVDDSEAHDASYDCWLAGNVAAAQVERYGMPTNDEQAIWHEEWRANFESYLRRSDPTATVEGGWPLRLKEEA